MGHITAAPGSAQSASSVLAWTATKTGPYTAVNLDSVPVDLSGGSVTITSPAATKGNRFRVSIVASGPGNTLTVTLASGTMPGGATSATATSAGTVLEFSAYDGTNWIEV